MENLEIESLWDQENLDLQDVQETEEPLENVEIPDQMENLEELDMMVDQKMVVMDLLDGLDTEVILEEWADLETEESEENPVNPEKPV